jgi:hypothetical protein
LCRLASLFLYSAFRWLTVLYTADDQKLREVEFDLIVREGGLWRTVFVYLSFSLLWQF